MIKIGSVVRLFDPHEVDEYYRNQLGIVEEIYMKNNNLEICVVRFVSLTEPLQHRTTRIYIHRLKEVII